MQVRIPTLSERLFEFAQRGRDQAERLRPGTDRDDVLQKVRQAEMAIHVDQWVSSPGLRAPT
ncbi:MULTISPECIES: hypothetical protein [unclassified Bradyrhizobium]|uniref:hypothetical protein n=1 Tax=unclassified Bradyrhizobium TaxID=2631580 RepID=UPI001FF2513B|nr:MULTISPECIES: hypothetical protein [unclassified Bradyrhizobium]MCJ9702051.1 hypothetical protein [Bradyrhizobium sp. SHOUNA76]MCJ9730553.1 hypothetical protein [Bradyrhizobium sp. PRIMUS42]